MDRPVNHLRRIRIWLAIFMAGLILSGVTAFPLQSETRWLVASLQSGDMLQIAESTNLLPWVERVNQALTETNSRFPFLAYGTDWLAFAHLVIAIAFIGPYIDPVRNKWVITFGVIACAGILPLALIAGPHPQHSVSLEAHRLQLRSLRLYTVADLQAFNPRDRERARVESRCCLIRSAEFY